MYLEYSFSRTEYGTYVMKLPEGYGLVEDFLVSDVGTNNGSRYLKILNRFAHGVEVDERLTGNTTTLVIKNNQTLLINNALEQELKIDTLLLRSTIEFYVRNVYIARLKEKQDFLLHCMADLNAKTGPKLVEVFDSVDEKLKKWA